MYSNGATTNRQATMPCNSPMVFRFLHFPLIALINFVITSMSARRSPANWNLYIYSFFELENSVSSMTSSTPNMKIAYRVTIISDHETLSFKSYRGDAIKKYFFFFLQILVAFALAGIVELKSSSKREKKSVTILGPSGYDFLGVAPIFSTGSWPPTSFGSALWNPTGVPDIPLTQVQAQATHNVALQVQQPFQSRVIVTLLFASLAFR